MYQLFAVLVNINLLFGKMNILVIVNNQLINSFRSFITIYNSYLQFLYIIRIIEKNNFY